MADQLCPMKLLSEGIALVWDLSEVVFLQQLLAALGRRVVETVRTSGSE